MVAQSKMETEIEEEREDRVVVSTAQHIVNSLSTSSDMSRDHMLSIFSSFDSRLSLISPDTQVTNSFAKLEDNLAAAEILIRKWDTKATSSMLFQNSPEEVRMYMDTVHDLHRLMKRMSAGGGSTEELIQAQWLMKMSMVRLEKEFHKILVSIREPIDPDRWSSTNGLSLYSSAEDSIISSTRSPDDDDGSGSSSSKRGSRDRISEFDMAPLETVVDLRNIAQLMAESGYGRECIRLFTLVRKSVVEESLYNLGVEKVRLSDFRKMDWRLLDGKIKKWIYAAKISIRILFAREKWLCDEVFDGLNKIRDFCFAEIAKDPTTRLLAFAEAVAASSRAPEKLFRFLDLYETLTNLMPDIEATYCQDLCRSVQQQADGVLVRLGEAARGILTEFEKAVEKENSKSPVAGGAVHHLTRYVMNYLTFLSDYKETLINLTADMPVELSNALPDDFAVDDDLDGPSAALSIRLGWIVFLLLCQLDTKSSLYKDAALSYLFMMNNLEYMVQKVKSSDLKSVVGEEWLRKQSNMVRQYAVNYERAAWTKVLSSLTGEGIDVRGSDVSQQEALKERLKGFNLAMEEATRRHSGWVVPDVSLREMVALSIAEELIPAYTSFLVKFRNVLDRDMYIKYTAEDVEDFLFNMFKGSLSSLSSNRSPGHL